MKKLFFLVFIFAFYKGYSQDSFVNNEGKKVECKIIQYDNNAFYYKLPGDDQTHFAYRANVTEVVINSKDALNAEPQTKSLEDNYAEAKSLTGIGAGCFVAGGALLIAQSLKNYEIDSTSVNNNSKVSDSKVLPVVGYSLIILGGVLEAVAISTVIKAINTKRVSVSVAPTGVRFALKF
jgi:hypothetical protein